MVVQVNVPPMIIVQNVCLCKGLGLKLNEKKKEANTNCSQETEESSRTLTQYPPTGIHKNVQTHRSC